MASALFAQPLAAGPRQRLGAGAGSRRAACAPISLPAVARRSSLSLAAPRRVMGASRSLVVAHGTMSEAGADRKRPGEAKGFVEEMRFVAMKLHTKEQAPKEGEAKPKEERPMAQWAPSKEGYLRFLTESKKVYDAMESIMKGGKDPSYAKFIKTGLERTEGLAKDIEWFAAQGVTVEDNEGPGDEYAKYLNELAESDPPAFICHYYNVYFAHSAGGRMIGKKVSEMILDGEELEFYKWDGDLKELLGAVRGDIDTVAEGWTREQKDHCLQETELSFKYSGSLLRLVAS